MSGGGAESVGRRSPKWESELWSHLSSGDGMHCPLSSECSARRDGRWCPDENSEKLRELIDADGEFGPAEHELPWLRDEVIFPAIERLAEKQLRSGNVDRLPVPIEVVSLADERRAVEVRVVGLKTCRAAIWHLRNTWVIQLAEDCTPTRGRFTLFHEAFHILAHCRCKGTPVFMKMSGKQGSFNELLADYYAICVLMPKEWVEQQWVKAKDLDRMAEIFSVPKSTMWFRLRELSLI